MSQRSLFAFFKSPKNNGNTQSFKPAHKTQHQDEPKSVNASLELDEEMKENVTITSEKPTKRKKSTISAAKPKRKRVKTIDSSDDDDCEQISEDHSSDEEYKPNKVEVESSESDVDSNISDSEYTPKSKSSKKKDVKSLKSTVNTPPSRSGSALSRFSNDSPANRSPASAAASPNVGRRTLDKLATFSAPPEQTETDSTGQRYHLTLPFLQPDNIRDIEKRKKDDPDYDPRTLHVPPEFKQSVTPGMRQWWELKSKHFDTVLFFKMGKFYEFFHMDADIGVKELGLIYMRGGHAHAGFPEKAYGRYADTLLRKGFKIARIEQTETPDMMSERLVTSTSKPTKFDKVVKREVCQITTPGTRTSNYLDGEALDDNTYYLLAICDKQTDAGCRVGVCFVDTTNGKIQIGEFDEDNYGSRLRTLVAHYQPGQILHERKQLSPLVSSLFKTSMSTVPREALSHSKEFWSAEKTLQVLAESDYFKQDGTGAFSWPPALAAMIADCDTIGRTPKGGCSLALSALGAVIWFLQFSFMDDEVLSLKSFSEYIPLDGISTEEKSQRVDYEHSRMVLDSVTLANLDILVNQVTGTLEGTLISQLDHCHTAGGKRLLREWLCAPLCSSKLINDRLQALEDLTNVADLSNLETDVLKKIPDLERLISRFHTLGLSSRSKNHPDSRAIMFENDIYSKRKIESFLSLLDALKRSLKIISMLETHQDEFNSKLLKSCTKFEQDGGRFPDIRAKLDYFDNAFDHAAARKAGAIHPAKSFIEEYDSSLQMIEEIKADLDKYLKEQRKLLSTSGITYVGTGRNRYQLEVPDTAAKRVPSHYEATGQRKGFKRYTTSETQVLLSRLSDAEDRQAAALKDTMRRIFSKFDESYDDWVGALECLSVLDVLISITRYTMNSECEMCRPTIVRPDSSSRPIVEIRNGRHPCSVKTFGGGDFIPNDTIIGSMEVDEAYNPNSTAELLLLTGPNMGGKSTLMRQVGLISILAQIGCYVPAESCTLTPIDRMFTRLGASDRIMHGESTFFVELSETSIILKHATRYSMVLLDELGRGTATHDGTAIASAVVKELCENIKCRTMFSTHYHSLVDDFKANPAVQLGHMACMVNDDKGECGEETITFLYKLAPDFCPKSYGFNVARLAGLPEEVIKLGLKKTEELEKATESRRKIRSLVSLPIKEALHFAKKIIQEP